MKKTSFTNEQIVFVLRQAETGTQVAEVAARWASVRPPFTTVRRSTAGLGSVSCGD
jgi:hypothetical protein